VSTGASGNAIPALIGKRIDGIASGMSDALLEAYRTTRFVAYDDAREVAAMIGEAAPEMDALLERLAARSGVFITAWNPGSIVLSPERNAAAAGRLAARLAAEGFRALPHRGFSADPAWQAEEGLFVLDIDFDYAVALAADFGQNAITAVSIGRPAILLLTPLMTLDVPAGYSSGSVVNSSG